MSVNKDGMLNILSKLGDHDLLGLANTVTEGLSKNIVSTRKGKNTA